MTGSGAAADAEAALHELNRRFRATFENAAVGLAHVATDGRWLEVNQRLCEIVGYDREALLSKTFADITHPKDLPPDWDRARRLLAGELSSYAMEKRYVRKDGSIVPVQITVSLVRNTAGQPLHFITVVMDISARLAAEEAVRRSEERLRSLADTVPAMLWTSDACHSCTLLNRAWTEFTGQPENAGLGSGWIQAVHPDDRDRTRREFMIAASQRHAFHTDYRLRRADGEYRWMMSSGRPRFESDGTFSGYVGAVLEIHDRRLAEEELQSRDERLREAEDRLGAATTAALVGTWRVDLRAGTEARDATWNAILGQPPVPTVQPLAERLAAVHPDDRDAVSGAWQHALDHRGVYDTQHRIVRSDGAVRWIRDRGRIVADIAGNLHYATGAVADITAQKEIEDELIHASEQKDRFLATLGHELRNPLGAIANALAVIRLPSTTAERQRRMLDIVEAQVQQTSRLLDDLLDMSRIARGKIRIETTPLDLADVLRAALDSTRAKLTDKHLRLDVALPDAPLTVLGDATRLEQVFANLIDNAAKYTPTGGTVRLSATREGARMRVAVTDDGIGLLPEHLQAIFEPFWQIGEGDKASQGLGIGLTLVRQLVELHGGQVTASSAGAGQGSEFVVVLPAHDALPREPAHTPTTTPASFDHRVLIVDDNVAAAETCAILLRDAGCQVDVVHDGRSALARAVAAPPHVLLLDLGLPDMSGFTVADRIRDEPACRDVVLVAVTGYGDATTGARVRSAGFAHHFLKPIDRERLYDVLATLRCSSPR